MKKEWLKPYAAFCFLRDFFGTSDHSQWGQYSQFSKEKVNQHSFSGSVIGYFKSLTKNFDYLFFGAFSAKPACLSRQPPLQHHLLLLLHTVSFVSAGE